MNQNQIILLSRMKRLIRQGKYRFATERKDRDYSKDLRKLGISEHDACFKYILYLNKNDYVVDYKPSHYSSNNTLVFKRIVNKKVAYIKLTMDKENSEIVVCLSFHIDHDRRVKL